MFRILLLITALAFTTDCIGAEENPLAENKEQKEFSELQVEQLISRSLDLKLKPLVQNEVMLQEEKRFTRLSWLLAIIGLVGLGTFGALTNTIIEKTVENRLEKRTGNITSALEFSKFYLLTLKLEIGESFTQPQVNAIMSYLRKIETDSEVRHSPEFVSALNQVMISFTAASQSASLDELFKGYEQEILSAPTLVQPLIHHYGQELIARDVEPANDESERAFEKLERVAASSGIQELALAYRVLFESKKGSPNADRAIKNLLESSTKLSKDDRTRFLHEILLRSQSENWVRRVTPASHSIQSSVREFVSKYSRLLEDIYNMPNEIAISIATDGIDTFASEKLAMTLSEGLKP